MKVFDFSDGVKGRFLGHRPLASQFGNNGGITVDFGPYTFHTSCGYRDPRRSAPVPIRPEDFGVDAICVCTGLNRYDKTWIWHCVGPLSWAIETANHQYTVHSQEMFREAMRAEERETVT